MMNAKKTPPQGRQKCHRSAKRAILRMAVLIVLLVIAGVLIWIRGNEEAPPPPAPSATVQPVEETPRPDNERTAREQAYDKDVATLTALIENELTDEDTRKHAAERLQRMIDDHQSELGIEEALIQAGFVPCVVLMQNGSLTVMISTNELTGAQSVTILSICAAHSDIGVENIRIMTGAV